MDWYTADIHSGHKRIIEMCSRPWDSVEAMEEGIIERWNAVVSPEDRVYILGDLVIDTPNFKKERVIITKRLQIFKRLNGEKHAIPGNHDPFHPLIHQRRSDFYRQLYTEHGLICHGPTLLVTTAHGGAGQWQVLMNHFPYKEADTSDDRYRDLRLSREVTHNMPLIHGHIHTEWVQQGNMFNVGMDAHNWTPVAAEVVLSALNESRNLQSSTEMA